MNLLFRWNTERFVLPSTPLEIPEETRQVAHAALRKPTAIMILRDQLGPLTTDADFVDLFATQERPGLAPGQLALALVFGYMEELTDRQVADAVRNRIDLKYALDLELDDTGFESSVFTEFRQRLVVGDPIMGLLDRILDRARELGLVKAAGKQRTDATHAVGAVQLLNRLELVLECMCDVLDALAELAPEWLVQRAPEAWFARYDPYVSNFRLPRGDGQRQALALQVGKDGYQLLGWLETDWVETPSQLESIWELAEVEALRRVWEQQFYRQDGHVKLRAGGAEDNG